MSDLQMKEDLEQTHSNQATLANSSSLGPSTAQVPALRRNFGFLSTFGFACNIVTSWANILTTFNIGLSNGGPAGLIYACVFVWLGTASYCTVLGELASMAPTAGGQYHWVYLLAPHRSKKFLSYTTGWGTICGWQSGFAAELFLAGTLIQGLLILTNSSYASEAWHATLIGLACTVFGVVVNTASSWLLPMFQNVLLILHIAGFFIIMIPLVVLSRHKGSQLFGEFINEGHLPTQGLSFMVGIPGTIVTLGGSDAAVHMSEEVRNPSNNVPRAIVGSILLNGVLGLSMVFIIIVCAEDIEQALTSPTGYPFMEIFVQATGSVGGAAAMASYIVLLVACSTIPTLAAISREYWALARDRGFPGWRILSKINSRTRVPNYAVLLPSIVGFLLTLINLGSSTAFNIIISLTATSSLLTYCIPISLLLWRRTSGGIRPAGSIEDYRTDNDSQLVWGPWRIPGVLGILNNLLAILYLVVAFFFSAWPSVLPVTAKNMNWSIVITAIAVCLCVLYYFFGARKIYKGPVIRVKQAVVD